MRGLVMSIPAAEGVHDGYDRDPDGIDGPGRQAAGGGGGAKLERAKADLREVESLGCGDDQDEQLDEVEVDDEIEERDTPEDEEDAGYGVGGLVRGEESGGGWPRIGGLR